MKGKHDESPNPSVHGVYVQVMIKPKDIDFYGFEKYYMTSDFEGIMSADDFNHTLAVGSGLQCVIDNDLFLIRNLQR